MALLTNAYTKNLLSMTFLDLTLLGHDETFTSEQREAFFTHCYKLLHHPVFAMAYFYFSNEADAEDLTAEFFEKLMGWSTNHFRGKENLEGYILQSARNFMKNEVQRRKRQVNTHRKVPLEDAQAVQDQDKTADNRLIIKESLQRVKQAINRLPTTQQEIIWLWASGYNHNEIAQMLKIDASASSSRLNRARQRLQRILKEEGIIIDTH